MQTSELEHSSFAAAEGASQSQLSDRSQLDLLELLVLLARHKKPIAVATVCSTLVAAIITFFIPNRYTATVTIMPPQQTQSTASMLMSQLAGTGIGSLAALAGKDLGLKSPNELYMAILKSRTIEDALILKYGLQKLYRDEKLSDARKELDKASDINSGKGGLIEISVQDKDPTRAAAMANSYVDELRLLMQRLAVSEASQRRLFFEQQLQQSKDDLAEAEVALKETQQKTGMIQLDSQSKAVIEAVGRIRAQIVAKEVQLRAMGSFATDQNPDYIVAQQELAGLRAELLKFEQQQPSDTADPLLAVGKIPAVGLEYVRRYREVKYREAVFEVMAKQFEAAKLDEAKEAAVIQVVDPAVPPDRKSSPRRILIIGLTALCSFLCSLIFVLMRALLLALQADRESGKHLAELRQSLGFSHHERL